MSAKTILVRMFNVDAIAEKGACTELAMGGFKGYKVVEVLEAYKQYAAAHMEAETEENEEIEQLAINCKATLADAKKNKKPAKQKGTLLKFEQFKYICGAIAVLYVVLFM